MGREVRRVTPDWVHPKDEDRPGEFRGLYRGDRYPSDSREWQEVAEAKGVYEARRLQGRQPDISDYMPQWPADAATHYQMYENVSEGTPISPVLETPEALSKWLAENDEDGATHEQWMKTIERGWAPSLTITPFGGVQPGVIGIADDFNP